MPLFRVTAPDGAVIEVNAPEGATEAQAISYAQQQYQPEKNIIPRVVEGEVPASETYAQAGEKISAMTPEPVKQVVAAVGSAAERGYKALPDAVQKGLDSTGNFIWDALDIIGRPFQAQAVALKETRAINKEQAPIKDEKYGMLSEAFASPASSTPENQARIRQAAVRGLKGEEKSGILEALPIEFRRENPILASIVGFAGDVVLDRSATTAPFQALKNTVVKPIMGAMSVPGVLKDHELYQAMASRSKNIDKADDLWNQFRYERDTALNEGIRNARVTENKLKALSAETGIPLNDFKAKFLQDIETKQLGAGAVREFEEQHIANYKRLLDEQRAAGIDVGDLGEGYIPHIRSAELDSFLAPEKKVSISGSGRPSAKTPSQLSRELEGTVAEINAKNIYGENYQMFRNDPAVLQGVAEFRAANAIAGKKLLENAKELGKLADEAPSNWKTIPEIDGYKFPPEVVSRINRMKVTVSSPNEINKFLKVVDGATNWWKMWSLGVRPSYHAKNTIGNLWNNYLGGLTDPLRYKDAAVMQYKIGKNDLTGKIYGRDVKEVYEAMAKNGVIGEGQYGGDIARTIERELGVSNPLAFKNISDVLNSTATITSKTIGTENPLLRGGFKVGNALEDNARAALFLDQVKKGASYEQAGKHVQKYLFDYGDISPIEQSVLKRVVPFYTWSRKNIPLQLESLVTHPDKINKLNLARQNAQAGVELPDQSEVPEYVQSQMPVYINNPMTGKVTAVPLSGILPFADLSLLTGNFNKGAKPQSPFQKGKISPTISTITSSVNPFIKLPAEMAMNYNLFKKKTIEEYKGQKVDFLGVKVDAYTAHIVSNLIIASDIDRLNPAGIFGTRTVDPVTKKVTTTPSIFGNMRESRTDLPESERALQATVGIRKIDFDPKEVSARNWAEMKSDLSNAKKQLQSSAASSRSEQFDAVLKTMDEYIKQVDTWEKEARERKAKRR